MADKAHDQTEKKLAQMERHLSAVYTRAEKEVGEKWKKYLEDSAEDVKSLQKAYDEAVRDGDSAEIAKAKKALEQGKMDVTIMDKRYKDLTQQLAVEISKVNETALAYVNGQLPEVYALNYNALDGEVAGYSFTLTDANTVRLLATTDSDLLPYKYLDMRKDHGWNTGLINSEVLQGILQGESMDEIASRLQNVGVKNRNSAIRNARTMVTGAENKGRQDSYIQAEKDGLILKRVWMAAHDSRTRDAHAHLDGSETEVDKPFDSDLGPIMFPGDPAAEPANTYNCRCSIKAKFMGFKKNLSRLNITQIKPFTSKNVDGLKDYSGYAYSGVNSWLRGELAPTPDLERIVGQIDSSMKKSIIKKGSVLYRGSDYKELVGFMRNKRSYYFEEADHVRKLIGKSQEVESFVSTSKDEVFDAFKRGVEIKYIVDDDINGIDMSAFSNKKEEREVLLDRGLIAEVENVDFEEDEDGFIVGSIKMIVRIRRKKK